MYIWAEWIGLCKYFTSEQTVPVYNFISTVKQHFELELACRAHLQLLPVTVQLTPRTAQ